MTDAPISPAAAQNALAVLERITDPFYALDAQWRIAYVNPPALAAFGRRSLDEVLGQVLWEAYPSSARDAVFREHLLQVARERRGVTFEAMSPTLRRWFEVRCHPSPDGGVAVYLKDVHDRRIAEDAMKAQSAALHAAERRLSLLLESIGDHLVSYDPQWRYTFVNDGAARMLGKPKEELLGRSIWELFPEAVGNQYWRVLHEAAAERRTIHSEHYYAPWDRWFENRIYPTADGLTVLSTDITERKRAEQAVAERERALVEADRRKDEFLATLAHELRNPLAPIRHASEIVGVPNATPAQVRWSHEVIERQVRHMARLLDDLLDVSRISRGTIALRREPVELKAVLDTAIETVRPLIEARRHELVVDSLCDALRLQVDANRLSQVLSNLLSNAAKYTDPGGRIELTARCDPHELVLAVSDTGIGIASGDLPAVFGMFAQVQSAIDRTEGGLGIGLALAKGIVELHGGTIEARSAGLGHGSRFIVRLPRHDADVSPHGAAGGAGDVPPRPVKILVADDNADAADTMALLLSLDGHDVRTAADGRAALALAREFAPDVLLLDIGMPGLNGFEVAAAVRREPWARAAMLVAVTGWGQAQDKQQAVEAGFDHHLTKPVDSQALRSLVAGLFDPAASR